MQNKDLKQRILEISKKYHLSHIGSCISQLPILEEIYRNKKPNNLVILDNAHTHLAHLMFIDYDKAEELLEKYGIHCDRRAGCDANGGSLGHAIGISIGYALANPDIDIYCIVSDGSMMEGSNWEALRILNQLELKIELKNIHIYCNFNGYTAVGESIPEFLEYEMYHAAPNIDIQVRNTQNEEGFEGVQGHYKII